MRWIDILAVVIVLFALSIAFNNRGSTTVNIPPDILLHQKIDRLERQFAARAHTARIEGEMIQRIFERTKHDSIEVKGEIFLTKMSEVKDGTTGDAPRE